MTSISAVSNGGLGNLNVVVTSNGPHTSETLTQLCVDAIMHVSETAPEPIRQQAEQYKNRLRVVVYDYIKQAKTGERRRIEMALRNAGNEAEAQMIGTI